MSVRHFITVCWNERVKNTVSLFYLTRAKINVQFRYITHIFPVCPKSRQNTAHLLSQTHISVLSQTQWMEIIPIELRVAVNSLILTQRFCTLRLTLCPIAPHFSLLLSSCAPAILTFSMWQYACVLLGQKNMSCVCWRQPIPDLPRNPPVISNQPSWIWKSTFCHLYKSHWWTIVYVKERESD